MPARFPARGPVAVLLVGEAPGPLGADRSGIPFWGDRSGRLVYRALEEAGLAEVPEAAWSHWEGGELARLGLEPRLIGAALSNAFPCCPTEDGRVFRAPSRGELLSEENRARLAMEIARAARRCPGRLTVIALGRKAEAMLDAIRDEAPRFEAASMPHPSAQALATGPGGSMRERERAWRARLVKILKRYRMASRSTRSKVASGKLDEESYW